MTTSPTTDWVLSIDFGTTATAAAACEGDEVLLVEVDNAPRMPSTLCWKKPTDGEPGRLLVGDAAENESVLAPQAAVRCPKYKIGQEYMLLGDQRVHVTDAIAQIFAYVIAQAVPRQGGSRPSQLRLTHPARWGERRLAKLRTAAAIVGYDDPVLIPEPVGAAIYFAREQLRPDDCVAVYDLGGGTFDTAVLRRTEDGFAVVGDTGGRDDLGGEDFDARMYRFLGDHLDDEQWQMLTAPDADRFWQQRLYAFKHDVRRAKERLSREPDATVLTPLPGQPDLRISRSDFESLIRADVESTVFELERTVNQSGQTIDGLAAIYLAGGSSQIPLVAETIEERLGAAAVTLGDPKGVTSLGAARSQRSPTGAPPFTPPAARDELPAMHDAPPVTRDDGPPVTQEPPVTRDERPVTRDRPPVTHEPPVTRDEPSVVHEPPPGESPSVSSSSPAPPKIASHFVFSIVSLLLFWPTAIPAIVNATRVKTRIAEGDLAGATRASKLALRWCIVSLCAIVLIGGIAIAAGASSNNTGNTGGSSLNTGSPGNTGSGGSTGSASSAGSTGSASSTGSTGSPTSTGSTGSTGNTGANTTTTGNT